MHGVYYGGTGKQKVSRGRWKVDVKQAIWRTVVNGGNIFGSTREKLAESRKVR